LGDLVWPVQDGRTGPRGDRGRAWRPVDVAKLDVDANPETARDFQVSIPTLILFKDGSR